MMVCGVKWRRIYTRLARRAWLRWHHRYTTRNFTPTPHQPLTWQQLVALTMAPIIVGLLSYLLAVPYL
jgi:hypothetical protein